MKYWIIAIRPKHWVKSGFCLAALIFSGHLDDIGSWLTLLPLLVGFCLLSSGGYLINDVINVEEDKLHPRKKYRPLAAGLIKRYQVISAGLGLGVLGFLLILLMYGGKSGLVGWTPYVGGGYFLITLCYSLWMRKLFLLDVLVLGLGFILRVTAGAFALNLVPTFWLLSCTYTVVLLIGFGKRQGERRVMEHCCQEVGNTRSALRGYTAQSLSALCGLCGLMAGMLYIAYCLSRVDSIPFIITSIPVIVGLAAYMRLVSSSEKIDSPENLLFKNPLLLFSVSLWIILIVFLSW